MRDYYSRLLVGREALFYFRMLQKHFSEWQLLDVCSHPQKYTQKSWCLSVHWSFHKTVGQQLQQTVWGDFFATDIGNATWSWKWETRYRGTLCGCVWPSGALLWVVTFNHKLEQSCVCTAAILHKGANVIPVQYTDSSYLVKYYRDVLSVPNISGEGSS